MAEVEFSPSSLKLFQKIRDEKLKTRIKATLKMLSQNPYLGKKLKGRLSGQYTVRVWPYRIIYFVMANKDVLITDIGHRKDIYR